MSTALARLARQIAACERGAVALIDVGELRALICEAAQAREAALAAELALAQARACAEEGRA